MPSDRRRKRIRKKKEKETKKIFPLLLKYSLAIFVIAFIFYTLFLSTEIWDGENKISIVAVSDAKVRITIIDPTVGEITNIYIPSNTQVEVARGLGLWKIASIWQLGKEEGLGGELLRETVTDSMKMPTEAWIDELGANITSQNIKASIFSVFASKDTNLKLVDRVRIALFSFGVGKSKRKSMNLDDTLYLQKAKFADEEEGYVLTGRYPKSFLVLFSDSRLGNNPLTVSLHNGSGSQKLATNLSGVVEVIGAKVASVIDTGVHGTGCIIKSSDKERAEVLGKYLNCKVVLEKSQFDADIIIGEEFIKAF